jgi:hypothetical protein
MPMRVLRQCRLLALYLRRSQSTFSSSRHGLLFHAVEASGERRLAKGLKAMHFEIPNSIELG